MIKSRISFAALALALALSTSASLAADLPSMKAPPLPPPPPAYSWTGPYVGFTVGYGFNSNPDMINSQRYDFAMAAPPLGPRLAEVFSYQGPQMEGFVGGLTGGYNYQWNYIVLGVEADIHRTNLTGQSKGQGLWVQGLNGPLSGTTTQSMDWFGTVRGRLGTTLWDPRSLIYVTGGYAYGNVHNTQEFTDQDLDYGLAHQENSRQGWTAGAGIEYAVWGNLSVKAEYLYTNLGNARAIAVPEITPNPAGPMSDPTIKVFTTNGQHFHTFRFGANYRFNLIPPAAAPIFAKY
jgi:opacity protein-like surface antigen